MSDILGISSKKSANLNLTEAELWFNKDYLSSYSALRKTIDSKIDRKANWNEAKLINDNEDNEFILVPIEYGTAERPAHISWTKDSEFIPELAKLYFQPIIEVLIISKDKEYNANLYQISYDRFSIMDNKLQLEELTGYVKKCDWDENQLVSLKYKDGKAIGVSTTNRKAKTSLADVCYLEEIEGYTTYTVYPNTDCNPAYGICLDVLEITYHKLFALKCYSEAASTYVDHPELSPVVQQWQINHLIPTGSNNSSSHPLPTLFEYNSKNALCNPGSHDRFEMKSNYESFLGVTGLINDIGGLTWSKGDALLKIAGANIDEMAPIINIAGKTVGVVGGTFAGVGLGINGYNLALGITDGSGFTWDDDGWNAVQVGLSVAGVVLLIASSPIAAVATVVIGGVSIGIGIYQDYSITQENKTKEQMRALICN